MSEYSREQIEQKRLQALERRKETLQKKNFARVNNTENIQTTSKKIDTTALYRGPVPGTSRAAKHYSTTTGRRNQQPAATTIRLPTNNSRYHVIDSTNFFNKKPSIGVKCYMITTKRFCVETTTFVSSIIDVFKTVPSKLYDTKTKTWSFHINDYEDLMKKIGHSQNGIQLSGISNTVLQMFRKMCNSLDDKTNIDLSVIDETLVSALMPFQRDGICYGISKTGRCMIADDMGLGKTIQALGIAHYFKESWPLLIVAPSSVRYQWSEAIYNFLPSIPTHYVHQFTNAKDFIDDQKIIIVSYDLLVRALDSFERRVFGFVILDESHTVKSTKTARFKAVQHVISRTRHVVLLSGTPALSRPIELYSQINLILPNFMGYQEYGIRYCDGEKKAFGWDFSGSSNMQELQLLLKVTCMIRRLKSEVLNQLPTKLRQVIMLDPSLIKAGTKEMTEMSRQMERKVLSGLERHTALLHYYNESSIARLKAVCNYVTDLFESKKKCIIYAHHQNVLNAICDIADSMKIRYIRIDGKTTSEKRKYLVDKFQDSDDYLVAVLSITAANAGVTLTAAQLVVFAELFWNPGILCQAEDRVHRIGQGSNVLIQYLVAKQTADDYIWPLIQKKLNVLSAAGLDQNFSLHEASVTKQPSQKDQTDSCSPQKQLTMDSFIDQNTSYTENSNGQIDNCQGSMDISSRDEFDDLFEIDEEDFNSCDWDNIE